MSNVATRLDEHDAQIRDLQAELSSLARRISTLEGEVDKLQPHEASDHLAASTPDLQPISLPPEQEPESPTPAPVQTPIAAARATTADEVMAVVQRDPGPTDTDAVAEEKPEPIVGALAKSTDSAGEEEEGERRSRSEAAWVGKSTRQAAPVASTRPEAAAAASREKLNPAAGSLDIEQRLGTNWLVWVGGVALALAGVFLVRYIAEQEWLTPKARCIIGVVVGLVLVVAGEMIRRRPLERAVAAIRPDYVPQALTAGGLATAFGSVYLAHAFYELIDPGISFLLLAAIAMSAFLLSVVQGAFVALLGLAGATLTPSLISSEDPAALGFFSYLGVLCLASVGVAHRRGWYWLPQLSLVAIGGWTAVWMMGLYSELDIPIIGATYGLVALASLTLSMRPSSKQEQAVLVGWLSLGLAAAAAMVMANRSDIPASAHWLILSYLIASAMIARYLPRFGLSLAAMSGLALVTIGLNYLDSRAIESLLEHALGNPRPTLYLENKLDRFITHSVLVGLAAFAGGLLAMPRILDKGVTAWVTGGMPLLLVGIGYAEFGVDEADTTWALAAVAVLALASLAVLYLRRAMAGAIQVHSVYATLAVASAFLALTIQFDKLWLTLSYAALTLVIALVSVRIDLAVLRRLVGLIVLVVLARLTVNPDLRGYELDYSSLGMQWITVGYLVPLALFAATARIFKRAIDDVTVSVLEGACLTLAVVFVSVEIRIWMTGSIYSGEYKLPEASLQTIAWLTSAWVLAWRNRRYPRLFSTYGSRILAIAGTIQTLALQLLLFSPVLTGESVGGWGVFNILILSLLAPAVLLWILADWLPARKPDPKGVGAVATDGLRAISALLIFAFVTLEVRVLFQGEVIWLWHNSLNELYITTLTWIALGGLPLLLTAQFHGQTLRAMAGIFFLVSVAAAVFGHALIYNPMLSGAPIEGLPVLNNLLLGFFLPAAVLYVIGARLAPPIATLAIAVSYGLVFMGIWLEIKHGFEGPRLRPGPESLRELYTTTLAWLALAALPLSVKRIGALRFAEVAGHAVLGISLLMLFLGHGIWFNPVFAYLVVQGPPIFNDLLLGFLLPALIVALLSRRSWAKTRSGLQIAAYLLLFGGVTLLVKDVFQPFGMKLEAINDSERYAYSAVWLVLAIVTMGFGIAWRSTHGRYAALAVLILVVAKVFLVDVMQLGGLWRIVSLFGLGTSLVAIGWIYQRFVIPPRAKPTHNVAPPAAKET